ncbi:hypothetical protein MSG28_007062 [Choristoneura fumiferana]|uniref:Uncharacterized protein n=1 Tax=Choristoneura fumiferana TaxID=7141 RepID=A0ACC0JMA4_CHOFU|nr:hypothetical protein MSG28_007062 [Choristoneura fumiferana]
MKTQWCANIVQSAALFGSLQLFGTIACHQLARAILLRYERERAYDSGGAKQYLMGCAADNKGNYTGQVTIKLLDSEGKLTPAAPKVNSHMFDDFQPPEQPGFRKGYSTVDHIHALRQVKQKTEEYNLPLCLAFVDYEKAFDPIETWFVL